METFDCPNCGQLGVTEREFCPDAATKRGPLDLEELTHSPKHLHVKFVRGCAACEYKDRQMAGFGSR